MQALNDIFQLISMTIEAVIGNELLAGIMFMPIVLCSFALIRQMFKAARP